MPENRPPLKLAHDYRHEYRGANGCPGWCRVRVYEPEAETQGKDRVYPVVLMSEPGQGADSGPSVTNAVEVIAAKVVTRFALPTSETVFVEHYERAEQELAAGLPETFDLVTFSRIDPETRMLSGRWLLQMGTPSWLHVERADVEALIGQTIETERRRKQ